LRLADEAGGPWTGDPRTGDEVTLLQAVLADPDADAPRLAYAGWYKRDGETAKAVTRYRVMADLLKLSEVSRAGYASVPTLSTGGRSAEAPMAGPAGLAHSPPRASHSER